MGQYASPYLGMGNNPVSMIDPDGGFAEGPGDGFWGWLKGLFSSEPTTYGGELNEVRVQSEGKSSSSNFFADLFDFNPHNTVATENRNFLQNWWGNKSTKNYFSGINNMWDSMESIPIFDFYKAGVEGKPGKAAALAALNIIPAGGNLGEESEQLKLQLLIQYLQFQDMQLIKQ